MNSRFFTSICLALVMICLTDSSLRAQTQWTFTSTDYVGSVTFNDLDPSFTPGGSCFF